MKEIIIRYPDIDLSTNEAKDKIEFDSIGNPHYVEIFIDGKQINNVKHFSVDIDPVDFKNNSFSLEQFFLPDW